MRNLASFLTCCLAIVCGPAYGATIVLDSFEVDEGHFTTAPSFSGSTQGETETTPGVGPSTADRDTSEAFFGSASQRLFLDDDPTIGTPDGPWRFRHLSGGGSAGSNVLLTTSGFVGYFLKTTTPNLEASLMIDDGPALERAAFQPIPPDGQWHLYEWELTDETQWEPFAGTGPNGIIDSPSVTFDSLYFISRFDGVTVDYDAVFFVDEVSANPDGRIPPIPEPAGGGLIAFGALSLGMRTRRFPTPDSKTPTSNSFV